MPEIDDAKQKRNLILATSIEKEQDEVRDYIEKNHLPYRIFTPKGLKELDELTTTYPISLIITDYSYQNGSLVDWLTLWPTPFILMIDSEDLFPVDDVITDESSTFILRNGSPGFTSYLMSMVKKVLNIRESLERQNYFLQNTEKQYMHLVQALPDIIYVLNSDGNFTFINNAVRILGWEPQELIGKHFSEILFVDDVSKVSRDMVLPTLRGRITGHDRAPKLFDERRTGPRMTKDLQIRLKRKAPIGGGIEVSLTSYGELAAVGHSWENNESEFESLGSAGIIRERNTVKNKENCLDPTGDNIEEEKALAHQEVQHLINNKLQMLSSLISLKQGSTEDATAASVMNEIQIQIYTLSLVYQNMVKIDSKNKIKMQTYLDDIIKHLTSSYSANPWAQKIEVHCDYIYLDTDVAIAVSMLINELLTIILKTQNELSCETSPVSSTFLLNDNIAQLKLRMSKTILDNCRKIIEDDQSGIIITALTDQLQGQLFLDETSVTLFFNI